MEFPQLQKGNYEHKKLSIRYELENNADMLIEFERKGFLAHNEVSGIIKELARNIKGETTQGALFKYICIMMDDEEFKDEKKMLE